MSGLKSVARAISSSLFAGAVLLLCACQKPASVLDTPTKAAGQTQVIQAGGVDGDTGWWPQIAFDSHDRGHIAYCDAHAGLLRYGTETATGWALETLVEQSNAGKYISLALKKDDSVGITYYNQSTHHFDYATRSPTEQSWHIEHIAFGSETGMASALRYSTDGTAHVLYYLASGKLIHASRAPEAKSSWLKAEVGDYQAIYSAHIGAAAEPQGLWFSYVNWQIQTATLYVAHLDSQGWQSRIVPTAHSSGWRSQLARVGDDLWVVHSENLTNSTALSFLGLDDQWHSLPLAIGGTSFAVGAYDNRGVVAFARRDRSKKGVYLTHQIDKGLWPVEELATDVGNDPDIAMAIDSHGRVVVLYYDLRIRGLKSYTTHL